MTKSTEDFNIYGITRELIHHGLAVLKVDSAIHRLVIFSTAAESVLNNDTRDIELARSMDS